MASLFGEFSRTYDKFVNEFPRHPLAEELKNHIMKGRFPNDQWMRENIRRMNHLMRPSWLSPLMPDSKDDVF